METVYQVTILLLLLVGTVAYLVLRLVMPYNRGSSVIAGPVHEPSSSGSFIGVIIILILIGALVYKFTPQETINHLLQPTENVQGFLQASANSAPSATQPTPSSIVPDIFEPVQKSSSFTQFIWQFGSFEYKANAVKKAHRLSGAFPEVQVISHDGNYLVVGTIQSTQAQVDSWEVKHQPSIGYPTMIKR